MARAWKHYQINAINNSIFVVVANVRIWLQRKKKWFSLVHRHCYWAGTELSYLSSVVYFIFGNFNLHSLAPSINNASLFFHSLYLSHTHLMHSRGHIATAFICIRIFTYFRCCSFYCGINMLHRRGVRWRCSPRGIFSFWLRVCVCVCVIVCHSSLQTQRQ